MLISFHLKVKFCTSEKKVTFKFKKGFNSQTLHIHSELAAIFCSVLGMCTIKVKNYRRKKKSTLACTGVKENEND